VNFGYSILLGEAMQAAVIAYHDCEHFQIVCPSCREPVFKAVREAVGRDATHYLSHYSVGKAQKADCELRVNCLSLADLERQNADARDQRLRYFWSKLKYVFSSDPMYHQDAEKVHWRLNKSAALEILRYYAWNSAIRLPQQTFDLCVDDYLRELSDQGWGIQTSFSLEMQKRIARDMWLSICTPPGRSIFEYLFNHAFLHDLASMVTGAEVNSGEEARVCEVLASCMNAIGATKSKSEAERLLIQLRETPLPAGFNVVKGEHEDSEPSTVWSRLLGSVTQEMIGRLIAVPYFELLRAKYGDPSKAYPVPETVVPVSEEEKQRVMLANRLG
jgi:hypothetical protein